MVKPDSPPPEDRCVCAKMSSWRGDVDYRRHGFEHRGTMIFADNLREYFFREGMRVAVPSFPPAVIQSNESAEERLTTVVECPKFCR